MHRWQAAGLYLEQSVSLEGKGNATVSRDTLGHLSSPFGTGEHRANAIGEGGLFPRGHGLGSQSERFRVPTGTSTYL